MAAGGSSIANNLLADSARINLNRNQDALKTAVKQLASGLRINSAADDPSGLAIAEKLQAQVNGFDQAVKNVQDANNAAAVADGALQTTTDILQRIRGLAVEASSDITSSSDKANLQVEVNALLQEVNRISQNTGFNGSSLLDGSHAGFQARVPAFLTVTSNAALASAGTVAAAGVNYGLLVATAVATSANFFTTPNVALPGVQGEGTIGAGVTNGNFLAQAQATDSLGFTNAPVPTGFTAIGGGVHLANGLAATTGLAAGRQGAVLTTVAGGIQQTLTGLAPGAAYTVSFVSSSYPGGSSVQVQANGIPVLNAAPPTASLQPYTTASFVATAAGSVALTFTNTGANDVTVTDIGVTSAGATVDGTVFVRVIDTGASIAVQETFFDSATGRGFVSSTLYGADTTASPFDNVAVTLGNFTTADVGVTSYIKVSQNVAATSNPNAPAFNFQSGADEGSTIQVGFAATNTQTLRISNVNLLLSSSSAPSLGAEDAIGQIDNALNNLLNERAQLGAVITRLNYDINNDNIASTNIQASESQIRDLNVGQASTNFTRLQILVQTGTSILAQANANAQSVLRLFP